jgi:hypothetical protein
LEALDTLAPLAEGSASASQVAGQIDSIVAAKLAVATAEHKKKIGDLEGRLNEANMNAEKLNASIAERSIADEVRQAAQASHCLSGALDALLVLGKAELSFKDGKVVTADDRDVAQWLEDSKETRSYFWERARGAGARGSAAEGGFETAGNPFLPGATHNLTKQGEILKSNPLRAQMLQEAAASMTR